MDKTKKKWIGRIILLIIIIIAAIYLFTWTGNIRCRSVPGMCGIYWGIQTLATGKSQPSVMIVYNPDDESGLGNPFLLQKILQDDKHIGIHPNLENIKHLSPEKLKGTSLVIVERSREVSTNSLEMFINYVAKGGRLIWIGDTGIELDDSIMTLGDSSDRLLTKGDIDGSYDGNTINGWARLNKHNYMIRFDEFLGVNYIGNFCDYQECITKTYDVPGYDSIKLVNKTPGHSNGVLVPSSRHPLVYGMRNYLQSRDDFAIVQQIRPNITPLKLDFGSKLFKDQNTSIGNSSVFPLIVVSNSNRVAYYAMPPEYLIEPDDKEKYYSVLENMIDGMVR